MYRRVRPDEAQELLHEECRRHSGDVQVWAKSLGNTFGGGWQSFREHLVKGCAAVASWEVDVKKECAGRESSHTIIVVSTMYSSSSPASSNAELHSTACTG